MKRILALLLLAASPALAVTESPRWGSFEVRVVPYRPNIDAEFHGAAAPYDTAFGGGKRLMVRGDVSYSPIVDPRWGTVDVGIGTGWVQARGHGRIPETGEVSGDATSLRIVPVALSATYRYEPLASFTPWFPFVPYGRFALERWHWWTTKGSGGVGDANGIHGSGVTNGYTFAGGIELMLDAFGPRLARDMDNDTGINHTYLYAEASRSKIDDFGSSTSWDLSPTSGWMYGFGLLFVF